MLIHALSLNTVVNQIGKILQTFKEDRFLVCYSLNFVLQGHFLGDSFIFLVDLDFQIL